MDISEILPKKPLLTVKEVAEALRVTPHTVRQWCRQGKIRAFKLGKEYKIIRSDLEALIRERLTPSEEGVKK